MTKSDGCLFILSGPSGSGKDTLLQQVLAARPDMRFSISTITRPMRPGEVEGEKYHFISCEEFDRLVAADQMLEHATYCGNSYGTPRAPIETWLAEGRDVLVEVDVQGARQIKQKMPGTVMLFVMPPSLAVLRKRLTGRHTDSAEAVEVRLQAAAREIETAREYDYLIINDDLQQAVDDFCGIIASEKLRVSRMTSIINEVLTDA